MIPNRKDIAKIGICLRPHHMVMNLMHIRRNNDIGNEFIHGCRQRNIGMIKLRQQNTHTLIYHD